MSATTVFSTWVPTAQLRSLLKRAPRRFHPIYLDGYTLRQSTRPSLFLLQEPNGRRHTIFVTHSSIRTKTATQFVSWFLVWSEIWHTRK